MFSFLWALIVGGIIGAIAGAILGKDVPGGIIGNIIVGFLGSWVAYKDLNLEDRLWYVQKMHVKL